MKFNIKKIILIMFCIFAFILFLASDLLEKTPVLIGFNDIKDHYGNGDFQRDKTASEICQDLGYGGCFAGQMEKISHYYESTDKSCRQPQLQPSSYELVSCSEQGFYAEYCDNFNHPEMREPEFGDYNSHSILTSVICFE